MGEGLFRKFGLSRGPGRPRNCPTCGLPETVCAGHVGLDDQGSPAFVATGPAVDAAETVVPRDPMLIRRSIAAIGRAARKWGDKLIYHRALLASDGDKAWASTIRDETSATDDECDALGEVTDLLLKELGLDTKYVPLAAALVVVAGAGSRYYMVGKSLNKQIASRRQPAPMQQAA